MKASGAVVLLPLLVFARAGLCAGGAVLTITIIEGDDVRVMRAGAQEWVAAEEEMLLAEGDRLRTGSGSRAECQFADNSIMRVNELSLVKVAAGGGGETVLDARSGGLWLRLKKLPPGSAFEVKTPSVVAGVRGTTFWVDVDEEEGDTVSVEEGEIEVRRGERKVRLKKLMETRLREGRLLDPSFFDPEKRKRWEKFTEKIVRERFDRLHGELEKYRRDAKETAGKSAELVEALKETAERYASAAAALTAALRKVAGIEAESERLKSELKRLPRRPGLRRERLLDAKKKIEGLLEKCGEAERDFASAKEEFEGFAERGGGFAADLESLAGLQSSILGRNRKFHNLIEKFRRERDFDPQWGRLEDVFGRITAHEQRILEETDRIEEALKGRAVKINESAKDLREKVSLMRKSFAENREKIAGSLRTLKKTELELQRLLERIEKLL
ncbi:MAG: FecR domain-containing protein [bacterium]